MRAVLLMAIALLAGCASVEDREPDPPPPAPEPVVMTICVIPQGMLEEEPEPERPEGEYTQRDVALYLSALHSWGSAGWERVETIDQWSDDCVQRTGL